MSNGAHKDASTDGRHADRYMPHTYWSEDEKLHNLQNKYAS